MNGYGNAFNAHARNVLAKPYEVPDYHLMVGNAERLESMNVMTYADYIPTQIVNNLQNVSSVSNGDITEAITNNTVNVNESSIQNKLLPISIYGGV